MSITYVKDYKDPNYKNNGEHSEMVLNREGGSVSRKSEY